MTHLWSDINNSNPRARASLVSSAIDDVRTYLELIDHSFHAWRSIVVAKRMQSDDLNLWSSAQV
jgi:hypothetical protein